MNILIDGQVLESPEVNRGIGIYFKNVLENMIKHSYGDNWHISVSDENCLGCLNPWTVNRLLPIKDEIFKPGSDYERCEKFTEMLNHIIDMYEIDLLWIPDPLMVNVLFLKGKVNCKVCVTVHDLIPYIMPIAEWSVTVKQEYQRRIDYLRNNSITMICVSKATEDDVKEVINEKADTEITFEAAEKKIFFRESKRDDDNPYIVFTGGFDYRKNIYAAVEAYQIAYKKYSNSKFSNTKFYIVCKHTKEEKENLYSKLDDEVKQRVILTGFIPDDELAKLYAESTVFFFPSLYEGFGLPILEAMLGGSYVLAADNSSLPEVCGNHAMLCDAKNVNDMADKLIEAFNKSQEEGIEQRSERQNYALNFTWENTAEKTLQTFKRITSKPVTKRKMKLAMVTPWPNQKTGIANYVYRLIQYLSKYFDIDVFVDNTYDKRSDLLENVVGYVFNLSELDLRYKNYDEILYQIGNSKDYHSGIYRYLKKYPGIAEIHDYNLHAFFYHSFYLTGDTDTYENALKDGFGLEGIRYYERVVYEGAQGDDTLFPMSRAIQKVAKGVIFHNSWSYQQMENKKKVRVIPHASFEREIIEKEKYDKIICHLKKIINLQENTIVIGCLGFVNLNKRFDIVIEAVSRLVKKYNNIKLVFWGKANSDQLMKVIREHDMQEYVCVMGYMTKEEYEVGIQLTDIVVNLRYPSMGESSGTLCEAFQYKKPVIVSAINQYMEFPDEVCWKLPVCEIREKEVYMLERMLECLVQNEAVRECLGKQAYSYAKTVLSCEKIAKQYYDVINRMRD